MLMVGGCSLLSVIFLFVASKRMWGSVLITRELTFGFGQLLLTDGAVLGWFLRQVMALRRAKKKCFLCFYYICAGRGGLRRCTK